MSAVRLIRGKLFLLVRVFCSWLLSVIKVSCLKDLRKSKQESDAVCFGPLHETPGDVKYCFACRPKPNTEVSLLSLRVLFVRCGAGLGGNHRTAVWNLLARGAPKRQYGIHLFTSLSVFF